MNVDVYIHVLMWTFYFGFSSSSFIELKRCHADFLFLIAMNWVSNGGFAYVMTHSKNFVRISRKRENYQWVMCKAEKKTTNDKKRMSSIQTFILFSSSSSSFQYKDEFERILWKFVAEETFQPTNIEYFHTDRYNQPCSCFLWLGNENIPWSTTGMGRTSEKFIFVRHRKFHHQRRLQSLSRCF